MLNTVVFPAPFGPMRPISSWGLMARLKSATAVSPPKRIVTLRVTRRSLAIGGIPILRSRVFAALQHLPQLAASEQTFGKRRHQDGQHAGVDDHERIFASR